MGQTPTLELDATDYMYQDGTAPRLLDIVTFSYDWPAPHRHQIENTKSDPTRYWLRQGVYSVEQVKALEDRPTSLWNAGDSSRRGLNDRILPEDIPYRSGSLNLVRVENMRVIVSAPGAELGDLRRKVRARFRYRHHRYDLAVTDPKIERQYEQHDIGEYPMQSHPYLCISLVEPKFDPYCYKLVASVIEA